MNNLTDTHIHLDDERYQEDLDKVLERAKDMDFILNPGCDIKTSERAIEIAQKYPNVYAAIGFHPIEVHNFTDSDISYLRDLAQNPKVLAIGEIGLDYHYPDNPSKEIQKEAFIKQIELAGELNLPFIVHDREAHQDTLEIIKDYKNSPGVVHAFSGSLEMAEKLLDIGMFISIGGVLTFKNAKKLPQIIKELPLDRIMLETDGPYLTPHPFRGQRNEPINTKLVAEKIAELKGIEVQEVCKITKENAQRFFKITL